MTLSVVFQTYFNEEVVLDSLAILSPPRPVLWGMGVTVPLPFPDKLRPAVPVLSGSRAPPFPGGASRSLSCRLSYVFKFFPLKLVVESHPVDLTVFRPVDLSEPCSGSV